MTAKTYSIVLEGVDAHDLSLSVLRDLCDLFLDGSQRAARLRIEGRSVGRGPTPSWATAAADIRIGKFERGSLDLDVRAQRLSDVAPEIFAQQQLFPSAVNADDTAFDLFVEAADDAANGRRDSERLDPGVLDVLLRAGELFAGGATSLRILGHGNHPLVLDASSVQSIKKLADDTPPTRVARVRGTLDMLTMSTKAMVLRLGDGSIIRGVAGAVAIDSLKDLLGSDVVLEGQVTFRPSGIAQRIEVESVYAARAGDVIWAQLPKSEAAPARLRPSLQAPGLDAFFGKWPGDETDEELAAALRELA